MEISEIKTQLTINQVLDHYGLIPNHSGMLHCPFHNDRTPSLQIYPKTNTYCCFSSNCDAGIGDVIEFIRLMEKSTKHEAILKAKSLLGYVESKSKDNNQELSRVAILTKYQASAQKGISGSERARSYATERSLDWERLKIGFIGDRVPDSWNDHYKGSATSIGLLNKTKDSRYHHRFKNCLIFALQNAQGQAVGIYGRSINEGPAYDKSSAGKHYYLPGSHQGLYPAYPNPEAKKLILTESIIDAATLLQQETITNEYTVLACYGTNGFIAEHEQTIKELKHLEEIIIFFDGDEAGRKAVAKLSEQLQRIRSEITISQVQTPEGEDVNSLAQSHEKEIFTHLLESRQTIFSTEKKKPEPNNYNPTFAKATAGKLEIHPHRIVYKTATANYYIKGKLQGTFETLRISLDIEHPDNKRKSRSKVDLYEDKQVEKLSRDASDKLDLRSDLLQLDLETLTTLLEEHRESEQEKKEDTTTASIKVPLHVETQCKEFLKKPKLIKRLNEMIGQAGVVGEETNRIFLFGIASSYKCQKHYTH